MGLDMFLMKKCEGSKPVEVAYWRKANQIREWFASQLGENMDGYISGEVDEDMLLELKKTCEDVIAHSKLVKGKIHTGDRGTTNGWEPIYVDGLVIEDSTYAKEHLPTSDGFFFGSTDYDSFYIDDLNNTIDQINEIFETTDWDKETISYSESW